MLSEKVRPYLNEAKNIIPLLRGFKANVVSSCSDYGYDNFFGTHTSIKVLTGDINAPLIVLFFQQLSELNQSVKDLAFISERTYKDTYIHQNNGVEQIQSQLILTNYYWEIGTELFIKLLKCNGSDGIDELKEDVLKAREDIQNLYELTKEYEPFKIHHLNDYFVNLKGLIKNSKEELNQSIKNYKTNIFTLRGFSTFLSLMSELLRKPSCYNYMAMILQERLHAQTITNLNDPLLIEQFCLKANIYSSREIFTKDFQASFNYIFVEKINNMNENKPFMFNEIEEKIFIERNNNLKDKINTVNLENLSVKAYDVFKKQEEKIISEIFSKNYKVLNEEKPSSKNPIVINGNLSFKDEYKKYNLNDLTLMAYGQWCSMADVANKVASEYIDYIKDINKLDVKREKLTITANLWKEKRKMIKEELKIVPKGLMFGSNIKVCKLILEEKENSRDLVNKLHLFYNIRCYISDKKELHEDSITKIRAIYKGVEYCIKDMQSLLEQKEFRYMHLNGKMLTEEKKVNKPKKKI